MSSKSLLDLEQQVASDRPRSQRPRTPLLLKLDTTITTSPSNLPYTPYSSFRSPPSDLPTPASIKFRQCLSIFQTLCLFNFAYPFRPGLFSQMLDHSNLSCSHLKGATLAVEWIIFNTMLVSAGYFYFCLSSLEESMSFMLWRTRERGREKNDLEKLGPTKEIGWEVTWRPGYFWVLAIGEILLLQGVVMSGNEVVKMGGVAVVVVLGWCLGLKAARPLGLSL
ncbi:hypothetical protein QBC43DRAFT_326415 [Cladorrhinum sp. PSN259]|nr:hypothetical protein QBC43DRAFT_326415 [Cladorrhinum sp. PSN259]